MKEIDHVQYREVREKFAPLSWWLGFLEKLLTLLPRRHIKVSLQPEVDLKPINADKGEWEATGQNPCFEVKCGERKIRGGWYYLETALFRHSGSRVAKLCFDKGNGIESQTCLNIPSNRRGSIREVFHLPEGVKALRWLPCDSVGRMIQNALILHRISWLESFYRRLARILFDLLPLRKGYRHSPYRISWRDLGLNLQQAYLESAERRLVQYAELNYEEYICLNDTLSEADIHHIKKHISDLQVKPLISIVMPVFNPPKDFFRQALDSVIAQLYSHWELCIADDASTDPAVKQILEQYHHRDSRIKVTYRDNNGHISRASNSALELATGEYIALMDQDDLLPSHALYHVAVEINRFPEANLIYSDEDNINESNWRHDPHFKSDWNPELFHSQNYINHLGIYRTSLVRELGGFRPGFEGSQDYDLVLRVVSRSTPGNIRHIPRVLYHWRAHAQSTALSIDNKNYAHKAGRRALQESVAHLNATVEDGPYPGTYHVRHPIPTPVPLVSLIIPTRDKLDVLRNCIESIRNKTDYPNWEILLVNNQSVEPGTLAYFEELSHDQRIRLLHFDAPFNYSAINNHAARQARGEVLGLINNDVEVISRNWLTEMVRHAIRPEIGAVGARLLYPDGRLQHGGVILGAGGVAEHAHHFLYRYASGYFGRAQLTQNFSAVTGACLLVKKNLFLEEDGLDETNLTIALSDIDFCLRLRKAGYRNVYCPSAELYHHESYSRGAENSREKRARFEREMRHMQTVWGQDCGQDPYYNINFAAESMDFSITRQRVYSSHHGYPLS